MNTKAKSSGSVLKIAISCRASFLHQKSTAALNWSPTIKLSRISWSILFLSFHLATQKEFQFLVFMGPKSMELLDSLGHDLGKALNFGFFNFIAKPCLWFMNKIHSVLPNYGIAIILLTLCTKIILWPLGNKSYKSMSEMKRLQPLMTEIREKHKGDKQKMNQELMALYKTYKVNPMGGCLPMVLQIPVFFALYRMLVPSH
jgi:YidC/Oxa1 family membrane protein insertase